MREVKVIDFKVIKTLYSDDSYIQTTEWQGDVISPRTGFCLGGPEEVIAEMKKNIKNYKVLEFQTRAGSRSYAICLDEVIGEIPFLETIIREKVIEAENIPKKCIPCDIKQTKNLLKQALELKKAIANAKADCEKELRIIKKKYDRTFLRVIQRFFKYLLAKEGE